MLEKFGKESEPPPIGAEYVRMQVGDGIVTEIGWIEGGEYLPDLLEEVAKELRSIQAERGRHAREETTIELRRGR